MHINSYLMREPAAMIPPSPSLDSSSVCKNYFFNFKVVAPVLLNGVGVTAFLCGRHNSGSPIAAAAHFAISPAAQALNIKVKTTIVNIVVDIIFFFLCVICNNVGQAATT